MQKEIFNDVLFQPEAVDTRLLMGPLESNKVKEAPNALLAFLFGNSCKTPCCEAGGKGRMPGEGGYAWN